MAASKSYNETAECETPKEKNSRERDPLASSIRCHVHARQGGTFRLSHFCRLWLRFSE
jgi:ribosomal protein S14